jgi:hypothetical protein
MYNLGIELQNVSGWVLWFGGIDSYFEKLKTYCEFNNQLKGLMVEQFKQNKPILVQANKLPQIQYQAYAFMRSSSYLFFPISLFFDIKVMKYINHTKTKISEANTVYGSLSTLLLNL